jgi:hypothetical protein
MNKITLNSKAKYIGFFTFIGISLILAPLVMLLDTNMYISIALNVVICLIALFVAQRVREGYKSVKTRRRGKSALSVLIYPLNKELTDEQRIKKFIQYEIYDNLKIPVLIGVIGYGVYLMVGVMDKEQALLEEKQALLYEQKLQQIRTDYQLLLDLKRKQHSENQRDQNSIDVTLIGMLMNSYQLEDIKKALSIPNPNSAQE